MARTCANDRRWCGNYVLINKTGIGVVAPVQNNPSRSGTNIASEAGVVAIAEHSAHEASKAGLINLTKVLALKWAQYGAAVNAISPTAVETPMAMVGWSGEKGAKAWKQILVGRFAQPGEIASAAIYLVSKEAGIITGENLMTTARMPCVEILANLAHVARLPTSSEAPPLRGDMPMLAIGSRDPLICCSRSMTLVEKFTSKDARQSAFPASSTRNGPPAADSPEVCPRQGFQAAASVTATPRFTSIRNRHPRADRRR